MGKAGYSLNGKIGHSKAFALISFMLSKAFLTSTHTHAWQLNLYCACGIKIIYLSLWNKTCRCLGKIATKSDMQQCCLYAN